MGQKDMRNKEKEMENNMARKLNPSRYEDFSKHTVAEIAEYLGLGKTKTREILEANLLPVTKIGRDYFTSKQCIQDFIQSHIGQQLKF